MFLAVSATRIKITKRCKIALYDDLFTPLKILTQVFTSIELASSGVYTSQNNSN